MSRNGKGEGGCQARGDFSFVFALPGGDERDAVGERLPAGALAAGSWRGGCLPARDRGGSAGLVSLPPGANRPAAGASLV